MTISDRATRLTAKVAPYREAILEARSLGLTWVDLCAVLGIEPAPDRLRNAVKLSVRYKAEQIPLPEPEPVPVAAPKATAQPAAPTASRHGQSTKDFLASLKQIGGEK